MVRCCALNKYMRLIKFYIALIISAAIVQTTFAEPEHQPKQTETKSADAKLKPYPLKTCVVSGEKLEGDMGKPFVYEYKGRQIKFCCKDCLKDFNKDPEKYIQKIEKAEKQQK